MTNVILFMIGCLLALHSQCNSSIIWRKPEYRKAKIYVDEGPDGIIPVVKHLDVRYSQPNYQSDQDEVHRHEINYGDEPYSLNHDDEYHGLDYHDDEHHDIGHYRDEHYDLRYNDYDDEHDTTPYGHHDGQDDSGDIHHHRVSYQHGQKSYHDSPNTHRRCSGHHSRPQGHNHRHHRNFDDSGASNLKPLGKTFTKNGENYPNILSDSGKHLSNEKDQDKIWRFAISGDFEGYEYIDEMGFVDGFALDLLVEVCKKAKKRCYFILDKPKYCWDTGPDGQEYPGIGLQARFYDACLNMLPTPSRMNSFNFTVAHSENIKIGIWFNEHNDGANRNLTGLKIGFVRGSVLNYHCLELEHGFSGNEPGLYERKVYYTYNKAVEDVLKNEIDAVLLPVPVDGQERAGLKLIKPVFHCSIQGLSVMAPYGSELIDWWNEALTDMKISGEFDELCLAGKKRHESHGPILCNPH